MGSLSCGELVEPHCGEPVEPWQAVPEWLERPKGVESWLGLAVYVNS